MSKHRDTAAAGMGFATAAYVVWGAVPIYWKHIERVPALEVLAPRIVCTGLLMVFVLVVARRTSELREFDRAGLLRALLAATLLSINWLTFIYAVQTDRVLATSLGYYINPLVSTVLGLLVLRERVNNVQGLAIVVAGLGVAYLTFASGGLPWIAVVLALSFGLYGLVHKLAPSPALAGLGVEMWLVTPLAVGGWLWLAVQVYGEAFSTAHVVSFGCVWTGLAIFTLDSLVRARQQQTAAAGL